MECCPPTNSIDGCLPCTPRLDMNLEAGAETVKDFLGFLFSPEPSNRKFPEPGPVRPRWMGSVKAIFWSGISIVAGTILAIVCR
jgi:hypothetical protein